MAKKPNNIKRNMPLSGRATDFVEGREPF